MEKFNDFERDIDFAFGKIYAKVMVSFGISVEVNVSCIPAKS